MSYRRLAYISLWFLLLPIFLFCCYYARTHHSSSGPALLVDRPKQTKEESSRDGATAAAAAGLPEVSSIQAIDIPFVQQPGRFVHIYDVAQQVIVIAM